MGRAESSLISALLEKIKARKMVSISHTQHVLLVQAKVMVCIIILFPVEEFETLIEKGHFLEYAKVFGGNYYGTSLPAIEENLAKGIDVF